MVWNLARLETLPPKPREESPACGFEVVFSGDLRLRADHASQILRGSLVVDS